MNVTAYICYTLLTCIISFIALVCCLLFHLITKRKFNHVSYIILAPFILGLYLLIPFCCVVKGIWSNNPEFIQLALKLGINPYERKMCYYELGSFYGDPFYSYKKDGNRAIEYYEKALKNHNVNEDFYPLVNLYLLKGDYDKVIKLDKDKHKSLVVFAYILQNKYTTALKYYDSKTVSACDLYMKASLLEKIGNIKESKLVRAQADISFSEELKFVKNVEAYKQSCQKYQSVEAYKDYIQKQRKLYGFIK